MAFYDEILEKVKDIDIGLVVLNAGVLHVGYYLNVENEKKQSMLDTNCYQVGAMINKILPVLTKRKSQSGIIAVSSVAANFVYSGNFLYSATKAFVKYLCLAISTE